jgi:hypothetical protein
LRGRLPETVMTGGVAIGVRDSPIAGWFRKIHFDSRWFGGYPQLWNPPQSQSNSVAHRHKLLIDSAKKSNNNSSKCMHMPLHYHSFLTHAQVECDTLLLADQCASMDFCRTVCV